MVIYKITNILNGKAYVGQTVRPLKMRMAEHKKHSKIVIDKAIKKYGINSFTVEVLERAASIEELNKKEIKWVCFCDCIIPKGYNQCYGGDNTFGYSHREESKNKMSESKKRMYLGRGNPFYGKTHSIEQKAKWSEQRKGRDMTKVTEASLESSRRKIINLDTGETFNSIREAALKYDIKETHISRVCRGRRKKTGGFRWQYLQ